MTKQSIDRQVTLRAVGGDAAAIALIYEEYAAALYRYIYARVGNVEEAEDIRSEVFLRMLEAIPKFED